MAIRKSKINIDTEERSDFDNMLNDVENEVEEQQAEDGLVSRVPELKRLSEDIDKATNTFVNATLELESAIQQYQRAEAKLGGAVTTISKKVDTINQHIDKVLENAPTKLKVSVNVNDADWQKIQELFAKERQWMTAQMQMHIREVNSMFADERKKVRERYKEYDGCYLGHYAQWFFWFFFTIVFFCGCRRCRSDDCTELWKITIRLTLGFSLKSVGSFYVVPSEQIRPSVLTDTNVFFLFIHRHQPNLILRPL